MLVLESPILSSSTKLVKSTISYLVSKGLSPYSRLSKEIFKFGLERPLTTSNI